MTSVALESTGVYWIVPHEILEGAGFEVLLADTRELRRVPGRRNRIGATVNGCSGCTVAACCAAPSGRASQVCLLRTLVRDKGTLVAERADWLRRMQKSLDQMNVRVHRAVADLDGATGMAMVRAIVAGERDPRRLAALRDRRCQKSEAEIAEQLTRPLAGGSSLQPDASA